MIAQYKLSNAELNCMFVNFAVNHSRVISTLLRTGFSCTLIPCHSE